MKDISPIPVRTIFIVDRENKTVIKITNRIILRSLIAVWLLALLALPIFDIWLRNTNYAPEKTIFIIAAYAFGLLVIGFVFIGILRAFQVTISLDNTSLLLEKPASKEWKLSNLKSLRCKKNSIIVEDLQKDEVIISKAMGYSEEKLLLLVNYLNDEIKKRKLISQT